MRSRFALGGRALAGEVIGLVLLVTAGIGLAGLVKALPALAGVAGPTYLTLLLGLPVLGAWQGVRRDAGESSPLAMAFGSVVTAWLVFSVTARAAAFGDPRHAVRHMLPAWCVIVPLASVLGKWLCLATTTLVPSPQAIAIVRRRMEALATSLEGEYDGWGSPVVQ